MVHMRTESQMAVTTHLRAAIWKWIDTFPHEFNDAIRTKGRMEAGPERVFDLLYRNLAPGNERIYWPTLMILNCIVADRIPADYQLGTGHNGRKVGAVIRLSSVRQLSALV